MNDPGVIAVEAGAIRSADQRRLPHVDHLELYEGVVVGEAVAGEDLLDGRFAGPVHERPPCRLGLPDVDVAEAGVLVDRSGCG